MGRVVDGRIAVMLVLGDALTVTDVTTLHPMGVGALVVACMAILMSPVRLAPVYLLALAIYIPTAQRMVVAGADFPLLRFAALVALGRIAVGGGFRGLSLGGIDFLVALGALMKILCIPIVSGKPNLVFQQIGSGIDTLGIYMVIRGTVRDLADLRRFSTAALVVAAPATALFLIERATGRNMLSVFGGVPMFTAVREGKLRCQGAFSHAILAGCFFVALLPLWIGRWREGFRGKTIACVGTAVALLVVFCCSSSTPVVATVFLTAGFAGYFLWSSLRAVWVSGLVLAFILNFVMKHGVWHLIARIDMVGGSTGYHRYLLIDAAINHFGEWALMGTTSTMHWGNGLFDITNQYILEGVRGGFVATLALFGSMVLAFRGIGYWLRRLPPGGMDHFMVYAVGAAIFGQMAIFLAVSYFGQTIMIWYVTIAFGGMIAEQARRDARNPGSASLTGAVGRPAPGASGAPAKRPARPRGRALPPAELMPGGAPAASRMQGGGAEAIRPAPQSGPPGTDGRYLGLAPGD
jgi:hypothetical protein